MVVPTLHLQKRATAIVLHYEQIRQRRNPSFFGFESRRSGQSRRRNVVRAEIRLAGRYRRGAAGIIVRDFSFPADFRLRDDGNEGNGGFGGTRGARQDKNAFARRISCSRDPHRSCSGRRRGCSAEIPERNASRKHSCGAARCRRGFSRMRRPGLDRRAAGVKTLSRARRDRGFLRGRTLCRDDRRNAGKSAGRILRGTGDTAGASHNRKLLRIKQRPEGRTGTVLGDAGDPPHAPVVRGDPRLSGHRHVHFDAGTFHSARRAFRRRFRRLLYGFALFGFSALPHVSRSAGLVPLHSRSGITRGINQTFRDKKFVCRPVRGAGRVRRISVRGKRTALAHAQRQKLHFFCASHAGSDDHNRAHILPGVSHQHRSFSRTLQLPPLVRPAASDLRGVSSLRSQRGRSQFNRRLHNLLRRRRRRKVPLFRGPTAARKLDEPYVICSRTRSGTPIRSQTARHAESFSSVKSRVATTVITTEGTNFFASCAKQRIAS